MESSIVTAKPLIKATPLGSDILGHEFRPGFASLVSPKFAAYSRGELDGSAATCPGTCNCNSVLGDGKTMLSPEQVSAILERIPRMNLESVMFKLMHPDEGKAFTPEQAQLAEKWYKRFLYLIVKYQEKYIVPHRRVDQFWHTHIIDTRKYIEDCDKTFGFYLHHFSFFGMRDDRDFDHLMAAGQESSQLYQIEFGESLSVLDQAFESYGTPH